MSPGQRVLGLVLAVLAGSLIGLTGAFVQAHRSVWTFDGRYLVLPWGVIIVLIVLVMAIRGAAKITGLRSAGWLLLAGWLAATVALALETPSGDIAVSSGLRQVGYLFGGVVVGSAIATLPARPLRAPVTVDGNQSGDSSVTQS